jgi:hypothetical protein
MQQGMRVRIRVIGWLALPIVLSGCGQGSGETRPGASPPPHVLVDLSGTGNQTSPHFTVGGDWVLDWSYDCSPPGTQGTFIVTLFEADGDVVKVLVDQTGGGGEDLVRERQQDSFYLGVTSTCAWHLVVRS